MAEPIQFEFGVTGEDQVSRALGNIEERLRKLEKAERDAGKAVDDTNKKLGESGDKAKDSGVKFNTFGSTLGLTGQAVGRFNAQAGQTIQVLAQSTGSVQTLMAAMGPLGLSIGLVTTAFALVANEAANARANLESVAGSARRATSAFNDLISAGRGAAEAYGRMQNVLQGGNQGDRAVGLEEARRNLATLRESLQGRNLGRGATDVGETVGRMRELENTIARLEMAEGRSSTQFGADGLPLGSGGPTGRQADWYANLGGPRATRTTPSPARRTGGGGGGRRQQREGGDRNFTWESFYARDTEGPLPQFVDDLPGNVERQQADRERRSTADRRQGAANDAANSLASNAGAAAAEFRDAWTSSVDDVISAWGRANTAQQGMARQHVDTADLMAESAKAAGMAVVDYIGDQATGALRTSVAAWLDGSKSFGEAAEMMAKSVVQALVAESIVQAVVETARGVAALASVVTAPLAPGHFAAAASWAAVGTVAGVVGMATGAVGSPAGGAPAAAGAGTRPMADTGSGRQQNAGTTVINLPNGFFIGDEAALGRVAKRMLDAEAERYG